MAWYIIIYPSYHEKYLSILIDAAMPRLKQKTLLNRERTDAQMRGDSFNCAVAMGLGLLVHYLLAFQRRFFFFFMSKLMGDIGIEWRDYKFRKEYGERGWIAYLGHHKQCYIFLSDNNLSIYLNDCKIKRISGKKHSYFISKNHWYSKDVKGGIKHIHLADMNYLDRSLLLKSSREKMIE